MFDDMIADIKSNKKINPIFTELFFKRKEEAQYFACFYLKV